MFPVPKLWLPTLLGIFEHRIRPQNARDPGHFPGPLLAMASSSKTCATLTVERVRSAPQMIFLVSLALPRQTVFRPTLTDHDPSWYGPAYSVPSRWRTYPVLLALPNTALTSFPSHPTEYIQHSSELQDTLIFRPATCIHYSMSICSSAPSFPRKMMNSIRGQHPSHSLLFYWKIPFSFTHLWVFTPLATDE